MSDDGPVQFILRPPDELIFGLCPVCGAFAQTDYEGLGAVHRKPIKMRHRHEYCAVRMKPILYKLHPSSQRLLDGLATE